MKKVPITRRKRRTTDSNIRTATTARTTTLAANQLVFSQMTKEAQQNQIKWNDRKTEMGNQNDYLHLSLLSHDYESHRNKHQEIESKSSLARARRAASQTQNVTSKMSV